MMKIALPIIIEEPGTLLLYNSLENAEQHLEAYDVSDGLYKGWDAEGRLLNISVDNNKVVITTNNTDPTHIVELESILREHLRDIGIDTHEISSGDLTTLVNEAKFFLYNPKSKWEIVKEFFHDLVIEALKKCNLIKSK